eukprot:2979544-Prymnesium_polylepis.1
MGGGVPRVEFTVCVLTGYEDEGGTRTWHACVLTACPSPVWNRRAAAPNTTNAEQIRRLVAPPGLACTAGHSQQ